MRKNLYNPIQKERFLESIQTSNTMEDLFRNVFAFVSEEEEARGADVCTWDAEALRECLEKLAGLRSYSSGNRAQLLKRYIRWCLDKHINGASNAIFSLEADGSGKIREMSVSGPADLQRRLDSFLSPEEDLTADLILRGYCWFAFMGLSEEESVAVESGDVSLDYRLITRADRRYFMPEEAFNCMKALMGPCFHYSHPQYSEEYVTRDRAEGKKLLRGLRNPEPGVKSLRAMLANKKAEARREGKSDTRISYYRIWLSGEFYRMYQSEQNGAEVDFLYLGERALQMREASSKPYKLESEKGKRTENSKKREIAREFRIDYERWKATYYPSNKPS